MLPQHKEKNNPDHLRMLSYTELEKLFFILHIIILSFSFLLNCIGILVTCLNPKKINKNLILFYLRLTENVFCLSTIIRTANFRIHLLSPLADIIMYYIIRACSLQLVLMMHILTWDWLICVINPLKYKLRVTKKKIHISVIVATIISIS